MIQATRYFDDLKVGDNACPDEAFGQDPCRCRDGDEIDTARIQRVLFTH